MLAVTSLCQTEIGLTLTGCSHVPQGQLTRPRVRGHSHDIFQRYPCVYFREFNGQDTVLLVAEIAINVLEYTEIPAGGMAMN